MSTRTWVPDHIPLDRPNVARMYDYYLGGYHNFEIDRKAAEMAIAIYPDLPLVMQANRAFLRRAVQFLVDQGIEQFLDLGSGIPTVNNVHEVAQQATPTAHVVYVDIDPIAVAHGEAMLRDNPKVSVIQGDARQPEQILTHPEVRRLLDLDRPLAVLLVAILHFVTNDEEAYRLVRVLRDAMAPGSYLVISHSTSDSNIPLEIGERMLKLYARTSNPITVRSREQIKQFFEGFELVEPGLVYVPLWRPAEPDEPFLDQPERAVSAAGVGRKP